MLKITIKITERDNVYDVELTPAEKRNDGAKWKTACTQATSDEQLAMWVAFRIASILAEWQDEEC